MHVQHLTNAKYKKYMYLGKDPTRAQEHDAMKATKHRQY